VSEVTRVVPAPTLRGCLSVPGDKSASHRALMLSALASGESTIAGLSPGLDVASTGRIIVQLGATQMLEGDATIVVGPADGLQASDRALDCGNSGTTMRLLAGVVSAVPGGHALVGDASLSRRPMDRVAQPLRRMGSSVVGQGPRVTAPLRITGSSALRGIEYHVPMASAQVKSAILLAGLGATGATTIVEDLRTRATTEDMFVAAGLELVSVDWGAGRRVTLQPGRPLAGRWRVPGDPSQAAFFAVLGAIHRDAAIEVVDVDGARERIGYVEVLRRMGADLTTRASGETMTLEVRSSALLATEILAEEVPSVDEVPVLAVAAAAAEGVSAFRNMGELRLKESDRFEGSMALAASLGCRVWSDGDDFFIEGLSSASAFRVFEIDAGLDHRMVMSSAVAGSAGAGCAIRGAETVTSSYPQFFDDLAALA
jgi:3-phosphoshikimate 1-carboxyvinyltransferase